MITSEYSAQTIYICRKSFQPKGICYGKVCRPRKIKIKNSAPAGTIPVYVNGVPHLPDGTYSIGIEAYLSKGEEPRKVTAYIISQESDPACINLYPPCSSFDTLENGAPWRRIGGYIYAELPLVEHCGVDSFKTDYSEKTFRLETPGHKGDADGENITLTFDSGGYYSHRTRLDRQYLIPGCDVYTAYRMRGFTSYIRFAYYSFQTNIFTSALVKGCGLAERKKFYLNPQRPENGFYYQYVPAEGGEGFLPEPEWIYDTRFRYLVTFREKDYWVKSTDFSVFAPGERAAVIKGGSFPMTPNPDADSSCAENTLSELNDRIVSEYFYRRY